MTFSKHLKTGEFCIGNDSLVLTTEGVGSCVVICFWDATRRIGAMAHMFQTSREAIHSTHPHSHGASPDTAVPHLLRVMRDLGSAKANIVTRLVGGGNMFVGVADGSKMDIGKNILSSTMLALSVAGMPLSSQSVGGNLGRSVKFSIGSGLIQVGLTDGKEVLL